MKRRTFIRNTSLGLAAIGLGPACRSLPSESKGEPLAAQAITSGTKQHWFGYYDKWQIDPTGRYALGGEVETFFRSPTAKDILRVGLIDLENNNQWKEIGTTTAWGWQQGCMLQWIPGSSEEVIWNDHDENGFISRIYNVKTGQSRTLPRAIYTLSPDGSFALCVDPDRLQFFRPGYGYPTKEPRDFRVKAPEEQGIYKMDLRTGEFNMIISYAQIAPLDRPMGSVVDNFHWFNHLLINPGGTRFIFLNRSRPVASPDEMTAWLKENKDAQRKNFSGHWVTRALTANVDGSDIYALNDSGRFSHFIWKGDEEICSWAVPEGGDRQAFLTSRIKRKNTESSGMKS